MAAPAGPMHCAGLALVSRKRFVAFAEGTHRVGNHAQSFGGPVVPIRMIADNQLPTFSVLTRPRRQAIALSAVIFPVRGFSEGTFSIVMEKRAESASTSM